MCGGHAKPSHLELVAIEPGTTIFRLDGDWVYHILLIKCPAVLDMLRVEAGVKDEKANSNPIRGDGSKKRGGMKFKNKRKNNYYNNNVMEGGEGGGGGGGGDKKEQQRRGCAAAGGCILNKNKQTGERCTQQDDTERSTH